MAKKDTEDKKAKRGGGWKHVGCGPHSGAMLEQKKGAEEDEIREEEERARGRHTGAVSEQVKAPCAERDELEAVRWEGIMGRPLGRGRGTIVNEGEKDYGDLYAEEEERRHGMGSGAREALGLWEDATQDVLEHKPHLLDEVPPRNCYGEQPWIFLTPGSRMGGRVVYEVRLGSRRLRCIWMQCLRPGCACQDGRIDQAGHLGLHGPIWTEVVMVAGQSVQYYMGDRILVHGEALEVVGVSEKIGIVTAGESRIL